MSISFEIFALFMLSGMGSTLLLPETKNVSLEKLSGESTDSLVDENPVCVFSVHMSCI